MRRLEDISQEELEGAIGITHSAVNMALASAATPGIPTDSEWLLAMRGSIIIGALAVCLGAEERKMLVEVLAKIEEICKQEIERRAAE
jgi:hypothetical protein